MDEKRTNFQMAVRFKLFGLEASLKSEHLTEDKTSSAEDAAMEAYSWEAEGGDTLESSEYVLQSRTTKVT
jgi:hypothetical protein